MKELSTEQLARSYQVSEIREYLEEGRKPIKAIIGQERAVKALTFGLSNRSRGFNVFVSGYPGIGLLSAVKHYLSQYSKSEPIPPDWCYVNNFKDPFCPKYLKLPAGKGYELKKHIRKFVGEARDAMRQRFESEAFQEKKNDLLNALQEETRSLFSKVEQEARDQGMLLKTTPVDIIVIPLKGDRPMKESEFEELSEEEKEAIIETQKRFKDKLRQLGRKTRDLEKTYRRKILDLEEKVALASIEGLLDELKEVYADELQVIEHLDDIKTDILSQLAHFLQSGSEDQRSKTGFPQNNTQDIVRRYDVNVLVDNSKLDGAPLVIELNPTYNHLFGKVEKETKMGTLVTDFTLIREGSIHKANGGFLVLPIEDLLRNPFAWDGLKRVLRNQEVDIEDVSERYGFLTTKGLRPNPIPLDVQVILIGKPYLYYLLYEYDDEFMELFKVKAEFDSSMPDSSENLKDLLSYVQKFCRDEYQIPVTEEALARLLEYGHRQAGRQDRLSTHFEDFSDLLREAMHYVKRDNEDRLDSTHIERTIQEKDFRSNLLEEKVREQITRGQIFIDVADRVIGQINGISVIDLGDLRFGKPSRITASVSVGSDGVVDIERETKLGGPIHSKGVMILNGFLENRFGKDKVISLNARLVFEQSYGGVEGDSASSAELYALLSAVAGVPLRQDIAVTGSVNQKGDIQPVGGINEKIEGFFEVCRQIGLTKKQGVLIPAANEINLQLKAEVREAIEAGLFHIWSIDHVDEGLALLTGSEAGDLEEDEAGKMVFPESSLNAKINDRLLEMGKIISRQRPESSRDFGGL